MIETFAPAKVNLTLHVTGRRDDGYHELDSLVMFADIGDRVTVRTSDVAKLTVTGPMADGVPLDDRNIVMKAAKKLGVAAEIMLEKNLPNAAGLGGGSSDAAATLKALNKLSGRELPTDVISLGADVPVCLNGRASRMGGIGDALINVPDLPALHAVLVNPKLPVMTAEVFKRLKVHENTPMPESLPQNVSAGELIEWLKDMRSDLQDAAIEAEPVIQQVFETLEVTPGCRLTRMSGSGGTCFGLYDDAETAASAAGRLTEGFPGWWVASTLLNDPS